MHHFAEDSTLHGPHRQHVAFCIAMQVQVKDTCSFGDSTSCRQVVSRDHSDVDAGAIALLDGWCHFWPEGILDAHDSKQGEVCLQCEGRAPVCVGDRWMQLIWIQLFDVLVGHADGPHGQVRELTDDRVSDHRGLFWGHIQDLTILITLVHTLQDDLTGTFCEDAIATLRQGNCPRHHLSVRGKHLGIALVHRFCRSSDGRLTNLAIIESYLLRHLQQGTLSRVPLELRNIVFIKET
mmetsp:Transcript_31736/g.68021  ORF Transcript_31736/g.68021 Transcript_31736/m.68021 type:complete len:237 (+) Transcript_31736:1146-1856(+)